MKRRIKIAWVYFIIIILLAGGFILPNLNSRINQSSTEVLSYYGSRGREVTEIQKRLKAWGYYRGAVDGKYGYQTYQAVRYFQRKNGLKVDGIAGRATLYALGLPTGTSTTTNNNIDLLARLIHGEARGEPYEGMVAVGAVVLNRVADSRFPNTISGVIYQNGAFDVVTDGQINKYDSKRYILQSSTGCVEWLGPIIWVHLLL